MFFVNFFPANPVLIPLVKHAKKSSIGLFALFFFVLFLGSSAKSQPPASKDSPYSNLIHYGDLIDVDVVGSLEFDWRGTLTPEGFLEGPSKLPKQIYGLCRTEGDIAEEIAREYSVTLRNPIVVVKVLDRSNRAVAYLDGAVKLPQRFQIRRRVFLSELIVLSGGITDRSSGEINIFRPANLNCERKAVRSVNGADEGHSQSFKVKISDLLSGSPVSNPLILSGDIVTITEALPVYVIGGVNIPLQISLRTDTTLSQAIMRAGGISKEGLKDRIRIFRRDGKQNKIIRADLNKILTKESEDPVLKPFDVIDIEQKGRGPAKLPAQYESEGVVNSDRPTLPLRIID